MELDLLRLGLSKDPVPDTLNLPELERRQQQAVEALVRASTEMNEFLLVNARLLSDDFRKASAEALQSARRLPREERKDKLSGLRLTVRLTRFHTVEMSWNKIRYINNRPKAGVPQIITEYIKRPQKSYAYPERIFSNEPDWCKTKGPAIETRLALLRQQAALIASIRENLFRLSRLTAAFYTVAGDKDSLPEDDMAFLDELMGAENPPASERTTDTTHRDLITTSEKCQEWMKERQNLAVKTET